MVCALTSLATAMVHAHTIKAVETESCMCTCVQTNSVWIDLNVLECTLTLNQHPLILRLNIYNFEACLNWHQACNYRNSVCDVLRNSFYFCCKNLLIFSNHLNTCPGFRHFHPLLRSWLEYRARNVWLLGHSKINQRKVRTW